MPNAYRLVPNNKSLFAPNDPFRPFVILHRHEFFE